MKINNFCNFESWGNSTYYLGLFNYLFSCLLTYLLVSGTIAFLVLYLFYFLLVVNGCSGIWMEK